MSRHESARCAESRFGRRLARPCGCNAVYGLFQDIARERAREENAGGAALGIAAPVFGEDRPSHDARGRQDRGTNDSACATQERDAPAEKNGNRHLFRSVEPERHGGPSSRHGAHGRGRDAADRVRRGPPGRLAPPLPSCSSTRSPHRDRENLTSTVPPAGIPALPGTPRSPGAHGHKPELRGHRESDEIECPDARHSLRTQSGGQIGLSTSSPTVHWTGLRPPARAAPCINSGCRNRGPDAQKFTAILTHAIFWLTIDDVSLDHVQPRVVSRC